MVHRREMAERKRALRQDLIAAQQSGELKVGDGMGTQRELAARYELSQATVSRELRALSLDGVLWSEARVGTFLGAPQAQKNALFVFVLPYDVNNAAHAYLRDFQVGFENRIARDGGSCATLHPLAAKQFFQGQGTSSLAGLCVYLPQETRSELPQVWSAFDDLRKLPVPVVLPLANPAEITRLNGEFDIVNFDDRDGARQAVDHLVRQGHRRIAFLGLHLGETSEFTWSLERERGWREALESKGLQAQNLCFRPLRQRGFSHLDQWESGREVSEQLLPRLDANGITGVVCANHFVYQALVERMRQENLGETRWPAIVSFDDFPEDSQIISALRLSWSDLGREAANVLRNKRHPDNSSGSRVHRVPMRLIPRLSCHSTRFQTINELAQISRLQAVAI